MAIDYEAMADLGFTKEQIDEALRKDMKAEGLLPMTLHFVLPNDARPDGAGGWSATSPACSRATIMPPPAARKRRNE
jgi:hypothetical protein